MGITTEPQGGTIAASQAHQGAAGHVSAWLFFMCALLALMVIVGGATRLTDSGLSITEWKPISGAVPPLSEAHWLDEFSKYQTTTEYALVNHAMTLEDFKQIYWWEWAHRFLGRFIGIAFALPLIFFVATRRVNRSLALKLFGLFLLGGAQGLLGWWMVQSGLTERVDVSQYRLAAHLALAILLFGLMFWLALDLRRGDAPRARHPLFPWTLALIAGVYAQMILGAFVAGLRAGRAYNTWPLMDGKFFPDAYFGLTPKFSDLFETIAAAQFNHRIGAYLLAAGAFAFFVAARGTSAANAGRIVAFAVLGQFLLGVWTLLSVTPLSLGLLHQAGALLVLAATIYAAHGLGGSTEKSSASSSG